MLGNLCAEKEGTQTMKYHYLPNLFKNKHKPDKYNPLEIYKK